MKLLRFKNVISFTVHFLQLHEKKTEIVLKIRKLKEFYILFQNRVNKLAFAGLFGIHERLDVDGFQV